jgi:hypothetical protein
MLAGDPSRRTLDLSDPAHDGIRYTCLGANLTETHGTPMPNGTELTSQSCLSRTAQAVCELRPFSRIAGTDTPTWTTQADYSGTVFTPGWKDPSTSPMVKAAMMVEVNAPHLTLSESWVSSMSSSSR